MKCLFLILFLWASVGLSQYEQLIKPVKISDFLSFTTYQFQQQMNILFKASSQLMLLSEMRLSLNSQLFCATYQISKPETEIEIIRSNVITTAQGQTLHEKVILKACNKEIELFNLERRAHKISATPNTDLLKGRIPDNQSSDFYRLSVLDRKIQFEITKQDSKQRMNFFLNQFSSKQDIQLQINEVFQSDKLVNQFIRFTYFDNNSIIESHDGEYIWNVDPKTSVPRQYFYYRQNEIIPSDFLRYIDGIYSRTLYPLIKGSVDLNSRLY